MGAQCTGEKGFSLMELIITMAIAAILISLATLQFKDMSVKASMEKQMKMIYADIMEVRQKALFEKNPRAVKFTTKNLLVYPGTDTSEAPVMNRELAHPITWSGGGSQYTINYDTWGITNNPVTICINQEEAVSAAENSIVVSKTRVRLGKKTDEPCKGDNVALK